MQRYVFMTGMPRSGTTLLDKLLSSHRDVAIFSQPLPLLYVRVKAAFLQQDGHATACLDYPLNDMFGVNYYPVSKFLDFLNSYRLQDGFCRETLEAMISFDGQYTKSEDPLSVLSGYQPVYLYDFVTHYTRWLASSFDVSIVGSKETFCEEYIPYFLSHGAKVIQIVRDPRDVIASHNYGRGRQYTGRAKPHLFNIRQWRKSIAFSFEFGANENFMVVRYEDLVSQSMDVLGEIADFLEISHFQDSTQLSHLVTQSGRMWQSNSSHSQRSVIDSSSVERYKQHLSEAENLFIQACCYAEMVALNYPVEINKDAIKEILRNYTDSQALERENLRAYLWSDARRVEEVMRWENLRSGKYQSAEFYFVNAFYKLQKSLHNDGRRRER